MQMRRVQDGNLSRTTDIIVECAVSPFIGETADPSLISSMLIWVNEQTLTPVDMAHRR